MDPDAPAPKASGQLPGAGTLPRSHQASPARIALYSHDTYGLGHLRRCLKIARSLERSGLAAPGLLVTGSQWSKLLRPPPGFRYACLPPVQKSGPGRYQSRVAGRPLAAVLAERREILERELSGFDPGLLIVDNVPCGLERELLPVLQSLRRRGCRCVLALRDVLDDAGTIRAEWTRAGADEAVSFLYDEVWLFGERESVTYAALPLAARAKTVVLGYLGHAGPVRQLNGAVHHPTEAARILVTGGGGGDAAPLVETFLAAIRSRRPRARHRIVLGPDYPEDRIPADADLAELGVSIVRFEADMTAAIQQADVVVAMAGYNTVCESLAAGRRLVLVPRTWPRREQLLRAQALAARGLAEVVPPDALSPQALWQAVERALQGPAPAPFVPLAEAKLVERARALLPGGRRLNGHDRGHTP